MVGRDRIQRAGGTAEPSEASTVLSVKLPTAGTPETRKGPFISDEGAVNPG